MECTYPFEEFQIESIECSDSGSYYTYVDNEDEEKEAEEGVCYFGQAMDIVGQVTVSGEDISRYMATQLKVCFQHNLYFFQTRTCKTYKTNLDLLAATGKVAEYGEEANGCEDDEEEGDAENQENNNKNNQYGYRGNKCNDMIEEGAHYFKTRLQIPQKDFKFHEGTILFPNHFMY